MLQELRYMAMDTRGEIEALAITCADLDIARGSVAELIKVVTSMTNLEKVKVIQKMAKDRDLKFKKDYSGRFMYGKQCVAVICRNTIITIAEAEHLGITDEARWDNMGRDFIVYWPTIQFEE